MSDRDSNQQLVSDENATRDIGGGFGGEAGPWSNVKGGAEEAQGGLANHLESAEARRREAAPVGPAPAVSSDPNKGITGQAGTAPAYADTPSHAGGDNPMSHVDADNVSTATTDSREASRQPDQNLGRNWTGETAPDVNQRENPPQRGGITGSDANDAY